MSGSDENNPYATRFPDHDVAGQCGGPSPDAAGAGRGGPRNEDRAHCEKPWRHNHWDRGIWRKRLLGSGISCQRFTDIRNVDATPPSSVSVARGEVDFAMGYASVFASAIDAGQPITVLAGVMVGCIEVFAKEGIHTIADLNGKRVGVQNLGSSAHVLLSIMCAQIGLDPAKDIHWISGQSVTPFELFVDEAELTRRLS